MATVDQTVALPRARTHFLSPRAQFILLFVALPLSWFAGLAVLFWPAVAFLFLLSFLAHRRLELPRRFGIWLLFLAWIPLSAFQLDEVGDALVFLQRYLVIVAATLVFLYVFNAPRARLPDATIVNGLAVYWAILVLGGVLVVVAPEVDYHSPAELMVPGRLGAIPYIHSSLHVRFADIQSVLGFPVGRPTIFFTATNAWGAMIAILTPFAFGALEQAASPLRRRLLQVLLVLSVVPIVVSLNRGLWIALSAAAAYVALQSSLRLNLRWLAWLVGLLTVVVALLFVTPLGDLISDRVTTPTDSNASRGAIYEEAFAGIRESPLIGHAGPRPAQQNPGGPPVGTHSHLLFISFSHGIPALLLFLGWLVLTFVRSGRLSGPAFWAHVALLVFFVQSPYYLLEAHLVIVMVAAALIWRTLAARSPAAPPLVPASQP